MVDYIFRRLAVDYLPKDERAELAFSRRGNGCSDPARRRETTTPSALMLDDRVEDQRPPEPGRRPRRGQPTPATVASPQTIDAPYCYQCGVQMQRAGSCFACPSCGSTSGLLVGAAARPGPFGAIQASIPVLECEVVS